MDAKKMLAILEDESMDEDVKNKFRDEFLYDFFMTLVADAEQALEDALRVSNEAFEALCTRIFDELYKPVTGTLAEADEVYNVARDLAYGTMYDDADYLAADDNVYDAKEALLAARRTLSVNKKMVTV